MPLAPVVGDLKVGDLNSVNFSVSGSKCSAPSGEVTQTLPFGSVSMVTAPPVGDMPCGGTNTSIFSVLGSTRPRLPRPVLALNQRRPVLSSRTMPCEFAAKPRWAATLNSLVSPVLVSTRPTVARLFGTFTVNQILPLKSGEASCRSSPNFDGVPSIQSLP